MNLNDKVQYTLHRSRKRRSISIKVSTAGAIDVYAPHWCTRSSVDEIVERKRSWIDRKVSEYGEYAQRNEHDFLDGDIFYIYGKSIPLTISEGEKSSIELEGDMKFHVRLTREVLQKERDVASQYTGRLVLEWYRKEALRYLEERTRYWEVIHPELGKRGSPSRITVRKMKRRWGSCDKRGDIRYNLQLICAPKKFIDCIIVHELCHRIEFSHNRAFMDLVSTYIPDYSQYMKEAIKQSGLWNIS